MFKKQFLFIIAAALLCAACLIPARTALSADIDGTMRKLESSAAPVELDLMKWKSHADMDTRCLDPHFIPDKTWKAAGGLSMVFPPSEKGMWLWTKVKIPKNVSGQPVSGNRILFTATVTKTADVYVNGQWKENLSGGGEAVVSNSATPGEEYVIVIHLVARRIAAAMVKPRLQIIANDESQQEILTLKNNIMSIRMLRPYFPAELQNDVLLEKAVAKIDMDAFDKRDTARFAASVREARKELEPYRKYIQQFSLLLMGYSHIDLAWLWDKKEGEEVWLNTSRTILNLMNEYPEWIYNAGQAAGYAWMENDYPEVFAEIKKRVAEGRWEIVGGTWAEFDSNVPGGESYVRQLLYGKRYFREKFGKDIVVAWTPDSFGYNWNLAQIYKKAGMIGLLTQKINWNDTTRFPYHIFWWEAPDGSRLMTYFPVGGYGESLDTDAMLNQIKTMKEKEKVNENYAIFGVGDHGGGVTRTHLNRAFTFKNDDLFPKTSFVAAVDYFKHLYKLSETQKFPVYKNELYLEYHRGTYTSQANTKKNNRWGEIALMNAENFSSVAKSFGKAYDAKPLRAAWDILMFNQFHDVLPGSSIREVYRDADTDYAEMFKLTGGVLDGALDAIAKKADTSGEGKALLVFNSLAWARDGFVEVPLESRNVPEVYDSKGKQVPAQVIYKDEDARVLLFIARSVPAMGYATYHLKGVSLKKAASTVSAKGTTLENEFIKVTVDPSTGNISSLVDKKTKREFFGPGKAGNMLQAFRDKHQDYDAWNIKLHEAKQVDLVSAPELIENGPVRATLRWTKKTGDSTFVHYLSVAAGVPMALAKLDVDWKESHVMAKLAFDFNLKADNAWYEIPYAAISRVAFWKTDADRAKWEVSGQKWSDYTNGDGKAGVSLLNNSKYGFDTKDTVMRISLLRSPKDPDPQADMHRHIIEYAIYPHAGDWRSAATPRKGWEFNAPLIARPVDSHKGTLPAAKSFFSVEPANVILASIKKAEDSDALILRLYEATGKDSNFTLTLPAAAKSVEETNLMEETQKKLPAKGNKISQKIGHYELKTLKVAF